MKVLRCLCSEQIKEQKIVKYTDMGIHKEVMSIEKLNRGGLDIKKLNKSQYVIKSTGEIMEYKQSENRSENRDSLRKTFKRIRQLINNNFGGADNELAFTVTYRENMKDTKRLYSDFKKFIKRLRYKYSDVEYLSVVEPQERGAWHCHVLLKFQQHEKIYIPNKEIADIWGHGFVSVKAIKKDVDNLGAYLSAYLGDIELRGENRTGLPVKEVEVEGKKKKYIKGGRLYLYPPGMNIYRKSKGIKAPESVYMPYSEVKKIVRTATPNYSTTLTIIDNTDCSNEKIVNTITYEQYNMKRTK